MTVVALKHTVKSSFTASIIDDLFALCALLFLVSTYLIFSALRTKTPTLARMLITIVDTVFLVGLTIMTAAAFMMVYTVW